MAVGTTPAADAPAGLPQARPAVPAPASWLPHASATGRRRRSGTCAGPRPTWSRTSTEPARGWVSRHGEVWRAGSAWTRKHTARLRAPPLRGRGPGVEVPLLQARGGALGDRRRHRVRPRFPLRPPALRRPRRPPLDLPGRGPLGRADTGMGVCDRRRFGQAIASMGFTGPVPSEYSNARRRRRPSGHQVGLVEGAGRGPPRPSC